MIGMTIVNPRSCNMSESTFPFIWKLQNHAFVRSISDGLSAVREIADIAYSTEGEEAKGGGGGLLCHDNLRNPLSRKITAGNTNVKRLISAPVADMIHRFDVK